MCTASFCLEAAGEAALRTGMLSIPQLLAHHILIVKRYSRFAPASAQVLVQNPSLLVENPRNRIRGSQTDVDLLVENTNSIEREPVGVVRVPDVVEEHCSKKQSTKATHAHTHAHTHHTHTHMSATSQGTEETQRTAKARTAKYA